MLVTRLHDHVFNGSVLLSGGTTSGQLDASSDEVFDPNTQQFAVTIPMSTARTGHTATLLRNATVLLAGGSIGDQYGADPQSSADVYDPPLITAHVNPKYVVVGITYAPPGPQSNVTYTNNSTSGNTTTIGSGYTECPKLE